MTNDNNTFCIVEEGDLTYDKTLKLLLSLEAAEKEVKYLAAEWEADRAQSVQVVRTHLGSHRKPLLDLFDHRGEELHTHVAFTLP